MPQAFLETGEDRLLVAALGIDDAVGVQAGLGDRRREQVTLVHAPQHGSIKPGHDPGGEQGGGRAVDRPRAAASDLMQGAERQPAARQAAVERVETERQDAAAPPVAGLDPADSAPQRVEGGFERRGHGLHKAVRGRMFPVCSSSLSRESTTPCVR